MNKSTIILGAALVLTNAWWAWQSLDTGVSLTYQSVSLEDNEEALKQSLALLNHSGTTLSRESIMAVMVNAGVDTSDAFEKDGYLWVGRLGIKTSPGNGLDLVRPAWRDQ